MLKTKSIHINHLIENEVEHFSQLYGLTNREYELLLTICQYGYSNKQLSKHLYIEETTVKNHLRYIFKKTKVRTSRELMALIFKHIELNNQGESIKQ